MKPVRCDNCQLFYDADTYKECPHCKKIEKEESKEKATKSSHTLFGWKKTRKEEVKEQDIIEKTSVEEISKTRYCKKCGKPLADDAVFCGSCGCSSIADTIEDDIEEKKDKFESDVFDEEAIKKSSIKSLKSAVEEAQDYDDQKTVSFYDFNTDVEPVVGWLVCLKGHYLGSSFPITSGKNNIGRSLTNSIALTKENSISRNRHASIVFDPNHCQFLVQAGDSSGLTYVNGELLMTYQVLADRDRIEMGAAEFMFVQLCNDNFTWDTFLEE